MAPVPAGKNKGISKVGAKLRCRRGRQHFRDTLRHLHHRLQGQHLRQGRRRRRRPARSPERRIAGSGGGTPMQQPRLSRALPTRPGWSIAGGRGVGNQKPNHCRSDLLFVAAFVFRLWPILQRSSRNPTQACNVHGHVCLARQKENSYPESSAFLTDGSVISLPRFSVQRCGHVFLVEFIEHQRLTFAAFGATRGLGRVRAADIVCSTIYHHDWDWHLVTQIKYHFK